MALGTIALVCELVPKLGQLQEFLTRAGTAGFGRLPLETARLGAVLQGLAHRRGGPLACRFAGRGEGRRAVCVPNGGGCTPAALLLAAAGYRVERAAQDCKQPKAGVAGLIARPYRLILHRLGDGEADQGVGFAIVLGQPIGERAKGGLQRQDLLAQVVRWQGQGASFIPDAPGRRQARGRRPTPPRSGLL